MLQKKDELAVFAARVIEVADCPASYDEFLEAVRDAEKLHKKKLSTRKRERAELLKRAQRKDATVAFAHQSMHEDGASPTVVHPDGAVARLRRLQGLPQMLVDDVGGAGSEVRGEFLLRLTHMEMCLRHPSAAMRYCLSNEEMAEVSAKQVELRDLIYSNKLPAGVWRRLGSPQAARTYEQMWLSPWAVVYDFLGGDHPLWLCHGHFSGWAKINHEIDRHQRAQSMSALINSEHAQEALRRLYGLPILLAWTSQEQRYANRARAREILLDGAPDRFADIKTARELKCYLAGQEISDAAPPERYFVEDWLANL